MIRTAWRSTGLALALLFCFGPFSAALIQLSGSEDRDCGMECCRRSKVCCCRKGKGVHENKPGWFDQPSCAGRCGHPPALPVLSAPAFTQERASFNPVQETLRLSPRMEVRRVEAKPSFALFGRPPPPATLSA